MTSTSTIYQTVYNYLVSNEGIENIDKLLETWEITDPAKAIPGAPALVTLCAALREDMRSEANKTSGKANIEKAMKAIIKNVPEHQQQLQGAFDCAGMQCACDGYRAIRIKEPIDLPAPPAPCTLDVTRLFDDARNNATKPLPAPTLGELKSYIKIKTAENRAKYGRNASKHTVIYSFGDDLPIVDAKYLQDILGAFPDAEITFSTLLAPLYFTDATGEAILSPIHPKQRENA